jgi:conjugal transfer pilus assembly protein TraV
MRPVRTLCKALALMALAGLGSACTTNTQNSWSCGAIGKARICSTIADIDALKTPRSTEPDPSANAGSIEGAAPVRWWEPKPFVFAGADSGPRREGDQVLKVIFAPWVDAQGDFHARSEVFSLMRRGGWAIGPSSTVQVSRTLEAVSSAKPKTGS